jgi:hypothetical protein
MITVYVETSRSNCSILSGRFFLLVEGWREQAVMCQVSLHVDVGCQRPIPLILAWQNYINLKYAVNNISGSDLSR